MYPIADPQSREFMDRLGVLVDELAALKEEAAGKLAALEQEGSTRVQLDDAIMRLQQEAEGVWCRRLDDGTIFFIREAVARMRLDGFRSRVLKLDDSTVVELAMLLVNGSGNTRQTWTLLNERHGAGVGKEAIDDNSVYRFADRLRAACRKLRHEYLNLGDVAAQRRQRRHAKADKAAMDGFFLPPLRQDQIILALRVAARLDLKSLAIKLDAQRMEQLCRLLICDDYPTGIIQAWIQLQIGRRIKGNTFRAVYNKFRDALDDVRANPIQNDSSAASVLAGAIADPKGGPQAS